MWPERTEEQLALEAGLAPFLDRLHADDRVLVRLIYDGRFSQRDVAEQLGSSQPTIQRRLRGICDQLRADIARVLLEVKT